MHRAIPRVEGGRVYQPGSESAPIIVESLTWYDWLDQHATFTFVDQIGTFTALKRLNAAGELVWEASRTQASIRSFLWLGPSHTLSLSRLQAAAFTLAAQSNMAGKQTTDLPTGPGTADSLTPHAAALLSRTLLRTKLYRPPPPSDAIPRARLLERLNAGLSGTLTLVSASAGYGKTTLLAQWLPTLSRPVAWLSLDGSDNELRLFVRLLVAALQSVFPDAFGASASLFTAAHFPAPERVATLLLDDLADLPDEVVLVLDDYHLIRTSEVHALLERLIEQRPAQLHLVLTTRSDPPLPLAKWRAQGHLNELRGPDLRFTQGETHALLAGVLGEQAAHEAALGLDDLMEGWVALLRLAALSLRDTSDRAEFLQRLRHSLDRNISDYLVEEVLVQLAPAEQGLLERASLLEQFSAELCTAVMDSDISPRQVQVTLDGFEDSHLFLVSLDERQGWYRLHPLFQPLLRRRLQAHRNAAELATLHRRASAWYAAQGLSEQAIQHALASGDVSSAAQLVEGQLLPAFEQERAEQMERWLGLLPEEQIQGSPVLLLARVWILRAHGQFKDFPRLLTAAERLLATSESSASDRDDRQSRLLRALIAVWWSQFQYYTGQAQASLQSALSALKWIPPGEEYVASFALMYLAFSNQETGQEDVALVELNKALKDHSTHLNSTARLLFALSFVYLAAGQLHQVEHTTRHLLQIAQQADLALSQNLAHWLLGVVSYEWNNLDAAVYHFSAVIANQHLAHFWVAREALFGQAFAYQAQGLGARAQETARGLLEWMQEQHNLRELMMAYAFCGQLALLQDKVEEASQWLEMAGDQEVLGPMMYLEDSHITTAWLHLAKGDEMSVEHGQALLAHLLQHVEAIHNTRKTIKVLVLQAWAYDVQGHGAEALATLERALALASPCGFIRTFADVPALARLLQELRKRTKARRAADKQWGGYLQRILAAMNPQASSSVSTQELLRHEGLEPLTERELHILRLLDKELSNKQIARELAITPETVKAHTSNLYRKLGVNNRRAAVSLAKALGLLMTDQAPLPW